MDISTRVQTFGLLNLYACFWGFIVLSCHSLIESSWAHTIHLAIPLPPFTRAPKYSNKKSEESLVCALHLKHSCSWENTCLFHVCTLITSAELLPFSCFPCAVIHNRTGTYGKFQAIYFIYTRSCIKCWFSVLMWAFFYLVINDILE